MSPRQDCTNAVLSQQATGSDKYAAEEVDRGARTSAGTVALQMCGMQVYVVQ